MIYYLYRFEIRKNLDLRKILFTPKIFLKSRFHCIGIELGGKTMHFIISPLMHVHYIYLLTYLLTSDVSNTIWKVDV